MRGDRRDDGVGGKVGAGMGEQGGEDKTTITLDRQTEICECTHGRVKLTEVNSLIPRLHLVCMSPSSIVHREMCYTESDPRWGWFGSGTTSRR